jgi:hypothetical protein
MQARTAFAALFPNIDLTRLSIPDRNVTQIGATTPLVRLFLY